jgi:NAD(P)-dependent dehydrogenase (short-subunit alcohol dehydrogenase family)
VTTPLSGQVAIVTGGGRGVGRAIARRLSREGAAVAVAARSAEELAETVAEIKRDGARAHAVQADVTEESDVEQLVATTERELGPLTLLVNNAGRCRAIDPVWEVDPSNWWRDVEVNLRGTFLCSHAALPGMIERGAGRIVNISSYVATRPFPYASAYASAKTAVLSFTEALAAETINLGISVFAFSPGRVRTVMLAQLTAGLDRWRESPLEPTFVEPDRVGEVVAFLASGRADGLSGRFLHALDDVGDLARRADDVRRNDLFALRLRREP